MYQYKYMLEIVLPFNLKNFREIERCILRKIISQIRGQLIPNLKMIPHFALEVGLYSSMIFKRILMFSNIEELSSLYC